MAVKNTQSPRLPGAYILVDKNLVSKWCFILFMNILISEEKKRFFFTENYVLTRLNLLDCEE